MRRAIGVAAVVIAAMAVGRVITDQVPLDSSASAAPFVSEGVVGKNVRLEYVDLEVKAVRVADALAGAETLVLPGKDGVFLVVDTALTPREDTETYLGFEVVDTDGRRYVSSNRAADCQQNISPLRGLTTYATFCFEVPKSAVPGAHFYFGRGASGEAGASQRRDGVADIDLGISKADSERLLGQHVYYFIDAPAYLPPKAPTPRPMPTEGAS